MNGSTIIVLAIIILVLIPAVKTSLKHLKGEGDCCGGPKEKVPKKKIAGDRLGQYIVTVEGMHCDSCKNRIERTLNAMDGVTASVNRGRKTATVSFYKDIPEEQIRLAIEALDFSVTRIVRK